MTKNTASRLSSLTSLKLIERCSLFLTHLKRPLQTDIFNNVPFRASLIKYVPVRNTFISCVERNKHYKVATLSLHDTTSIKAFYISVCLPVCLSFRFACLAAYLPACLSVNLSICVLACMHASLPVCLSISPSVC
jgi:hypothetical protein